MIILVDIVHLLCRERETKLHSLLTSFCLYIQYRNMHGCKNVSICHISQSHPLKVLWGTNKTTNPAKQQLCFMFQFCEVQFFFSLIETSIQALLSFFEGQGWWCIHLSLDFPLTTSVFPLIYQLSSVYLCQSKVAVVAFRYTALMENYSFCVSQLIVENSCAS